jgi:hypothetical protein
VNWRAFPVLLVAFTLGLGGAAAAQEAEAPDESGLDLSLRSGYALLTGLPNSLVYGMIPVRLEGRYLFDSHRALGLFFQYGHGLTHPQGDCVASGGCSAADYLFGVDLSYRNRPIGRMTPWEAIAVGYEILHLDSKSLRGWQYAEFQLGVDFALGRAVLLGPFASASVAGFGTVSTGAGDYDLPASLLQYCVQLGLRFTFGL